MFVLMARRTQNGRIGDHAVRRMEKATARVARVQKTPGSREAGSVCRTRANVEQNRA
jgi:hypothetical protein